MFSWYLNSISKLAFNSSYPQQPQTTPSNYQNQPQGHRGMSFIGGVNSAGIGVRNSTGREVLDASANFNGSRYEVNYRPDPNVVISGFKDKNKGSGFNVNVNLAGMFGRKPGQQGQNYQPKMQPYGPRPVNYIPGNGESYQSTHPRESSAARHAAGKFIKDIPEIQKLKGNATNAVKGIFQSGQRKVAAELNFENRNNHFDDIYSLSKNFTAMLNWNKHF